jgi:hypothetical protein
MYSCKDRLRAVLLIAGIGIALSGCGSLPGGAGVPSASVQPDPSAAAASPTSPAAPAISDLEQARVALIDFFSALAGGRYTEATMLYGGSYEELTGFNAMVPRDEYPQLFQNACTTNGFQCLEVQTVVDAREVAPGEFAFVVEFQNEDGSLFSRGSAGGSSATAQPAQSQWTYTVKKVGDLFLVQELPVYLP